jgi:hypothetical protein
LGLYPLARNSFAGGSDAELAMPSIPDLRSTEDRLNRKKVRLKKPDFSPLLVELIANCS